MKTIIMILMMVLVVFITIKAEADSRQLEALKKARDSAVEKELAKFESAVKQIDDAHQKKLIKLRTSATKKGDQETQKEIKDEFERVFGTIGVIGPKLAAVTVKNAALKEIATGTRVFGDDDKYVWDKIPERYKDLSYWQPNSKFQLTELEVDGDGMVYIAVIERASKLAKIKDLKEWTKLFDDLKQTDGTKWNVYSKICKRGETLLLQRDNFGYAAAIPLQ